MCEQCGKKFGNKWALVAHRKCHNPDRPYNCQNCTKSFAKIKDLKRHNLTHLGIYGYTFLKIVLIKTDLFFFRYKTI